MFDVFSFQGLNKIFQPGRLECHVVEETLPLISKLSVA